MKESNTSTLSIQQPASLIQERLALFTPWWEACKQVLPIFLLTRISLLLATHLGAVAFMVPNNSTVALNAQGVLYSWFHWDTPRYIAIASTGYRDITTTGFFPLYPTLLKLCSKFLHIDVLLSGMLISNLALLLALIVLYRLIADDWDQPTGRTSILYLSLFPTAFLLFTAYNLSVLLCFSVLSFYTMRKGFWWLAALFGALATLTDLLGLFLCVVFLCEFGLHIRSAVTRVGLRAWLSAPAFLLIPLGTVLYSYSLGRKFLDPFAFLHPQGTNILTWPWLSLQSALNLLLHTSMYTYGWLHSAFELGIAACLLAVLAYGCRSALRGQTHYWSYLAGGIFIFLYACSLPAAPGGQASPLDPLPALQSAILVGTIVFVLIARLGLRYRWLHYSYLLLATSVQTFLILQLLTGRWAL